MAYGINSHIGISFQNSFGVSNVDSMHYFPVINETLVKNIPPLASEAIRGRFEAGPAYDSMHELAGDIVFDGHPILIGKMLKAWFGQSSASIVNSYYNHKFIPITEDFCNLAAVPPMSIEVWRSVGSAHLFSDAVCNQLVIEIAHNAIVKCTASIIAAGHAKVNKSTPNYLSGSDYTFNQASFSWQGSQDGAIDTLNTFTVTLNNNLEALGTLNGTLLPSRIKRSNYRQITISGQMIFENDNEMDHYFAGAEQQIITTLVGQDIGDGDLAAFIMDFPSMRYSEVSANIGGTGQVPISFSGEAKYHADSGTAAQFTLQNTLSAY